MRVILILITVAAAAIGAPKTESQRSRFLFVVDVSSSMRKLDAGNRQALFDLVYSGVDNYMTAGDTFGVWTFNTKLAAGEFPMHEWHPTNTLQAASSAATFLKKKRYSGDCDFTPLLFSVNKLMKAVKDVNVVILTDGETPMNGTSKDEEINAAFRTRAAERKKAEKPFIVSLAIRGGAITNCFVTLPGEPIPLPPPPPKLAVKPPVREITNAPVVAKPVITRPPLIMKGTPKPTVEVTAATAPSDTTVAPAVAKEPATTATNAEPAVGKTSKTPDNLSNSTAGTAPKPDESLASFAPAILLDPRQSSSTVVPSLDNHTAKPADENQAAASTPTPTPALSSKESALPDSAMPFPKESFPLNAQPLGGGNSADNAIPTTMGLDPQWLMVAGCMLLLGVFAVLLMIYRRMHRLPSPSIITRSMERQ